MVARRGERMPAGAQLELSGSISRDAGSAQSACPAWAVSFLGYGKPRRPLAVTVTGFPTSGRASRLAPPDYRLKVLRKPRSTGSPLAAYLVRTVRTIERKIQRMMNIGLLRSGLNDIP
jgi:hypothetical protein